jgi:hypothetical protein
MKQTRLRLVSTAAVTCFLAVLGPSIAHAAKPEFKPPAGKNFPFNFTGSSGKSTIVEKDSTEKFTCKADSVTGEITGAKSVAMVGFKYTGCENSKSVKCQNTATAGEIVTEKLTGILVYIKGKTEPAIKLKVENAAKRPVVASFKCGGQGYKLKEEVMSKVSPVDKPADKYKFIYTQVKGVQEVLEAEGESNIPLEVEEESACPNMSEAGLESEEEIEIAEMIELEVFS